MGGGSAMLIPTSTLAIAGLGNTITNAKSIVAKNNFFIFILLPLIRITVLSPFN
jgi:hypothetical protein